VVQVEAVGSTARQRHRMLLPRRRLLRRNKEHC